MHIILFTHPDFLAHKSMPRYAGMLSEGMRKRKHTVEIWSPEPYFFNLPIPKKFKKWMGYIDQYIVFPYNIKSKIKQSSPNTLFVFADQALGPWVPLVANRSHAIHCHDFLAQRSALAQIKENPTGWTGSKYQEYIRKGYQRGRNFISVSKRTQHDLHSFLITEPLISEVVYNGMNQKFDSIDKNNARQLITNKIGINLDSGYLLHVGGNQFYKNRTGVIELYNAWRQKSDLQYPLLLIGESPSDELKELHNQSAYKNEIHFLSDINDSDVRLAYAGASVFLFPSLAEGFGWPIAEAMASGTPVITTNDAPMTEVAGDAAFFLPVKPTAKNDIAEWAKEGAIIIDQVLKLPEDKLTKVIQAGLVNAQRFDTEKTLDTIEKIYFRIVNRNKIASVRSDFVNPQ